MIFSILVTQKPSTSFLVAAIVAEKAMPGWHAVIPADVNPNPVTDAMPGLTLAQLQAKFKGSKPSAHLSTVPVPHAGNGPGPKTVIVSANTVVGFQG